MIFYNSIYHVLDTWVGKMPWRREIMPIPVFWPGEFHGLYNPLGCKESDRIEWLSLSLSSHAQLCQKLWNPLDCSPTGSSVPGILQAKILEWVAIFFSKGFSRSGIESESFVSVALQDDSLPVEPLWVEYFIILLHH